MTKPCTLILCIDEFEDGSDLETWECAFDFTDGPAIVGVGGVDLSSGFDPEGSPIVSSESALCAPGMVVTNRVAQVATGVSPIVGKRLGRRLDANA